VTANAPYLTLSRTGMALRLALFYGVVCLYNALAVPFWPVWLKDHGMSANDIALLFAATYVTRMIASPLIGSLADRNGDVRRTLLIIIAGAGFATSGFFWSEGFIAILAVTVLSTIFWPAIFPLMEVVTLRGSASHGLDYARVRVSGSITFMLGSLGAGITIGHLGTGFVLPGLVAILALAFAAGLALPAFPTARGSKAPSGALMILLKNPAFLYLAIGGSLIQSSHGIYYAFGTLNWQAQGYDPAIIGLFWSVGVLAEIMLFIFSAPLVRHLGPRRLLFIGGSAAIIRWTVLGLQPDFWIIILVQTLHALTYACTHLGAMRFFSTAIPQNSAASAQSLYAALFHGLFFGVVTFAAGPLFSQFGGSVYYLSAGFAAAGLFCTWRLGRVWSEGMIRL